jgi:hypothetical protein
MIKKIIARFCFLLSFSVNAQQGTSSPYSFYGIGDVKLSGAIENNAMGGVGIFRDSLRINFQNPASFSNLKFTTFTVAASSENTTLKNESQSESASRVYIDYLAVGLPLGKLGASFGLLPYSSVGYNINSLNNEEGAVNSTFVGSGGVNRVFGGLGYQLAKGLSFGVDLGYHFGIINTTATEYITGIQFGTSEINESRVSGFTAKVGTMFQKPISDKVTLSGGITFSPQGEYNVINERVIGIVRIVGPNGQAIPQESELINTPDVKINIPSQFTFGLGIGTEMKWGMGAEIKLSESSNFGNRFAAVDNVSYENARKYSFGGYFVPNYNSFSSYWSRSTYRAGFRYENTGLVINDQSINDLGITFGMSLPVGGYGSNLNIGLEFGKRGTTKAGLIQENYTNLSLSLSLNDRWFEKRKFN